MEDSRCVGFTLCTNSTTALVFIHCDVQLFKWMAFRSFFSQRNLFLCNFYDQINKTFEKKNCLFWYKLLKFLKICRLTRTRSDIKKMLKSKLTYFCPWDCCDLNYLTKNPLLCYDFSLLFIISSSCAPCTIDVTLRAMLKNFQYISLRFYFLLYLLSNLIDAKEIT